MASLDKRTLKQLEAQFLQRYPQGFQDPAIQAIVKKHRVDKMTEMAQAAFAKNAFKDTQACVDNMIAIIGRSSMVSMFEKPKFRDFAKGLNSHDQDFMVSALKQFLHGNQRHGFEALTDILKSRKLAKWSLLTIIPTYYAPAVEVFVKPTTAKGILAYFAVEDLIYKPTPSWAFYSGYRALINDAKAKLRKSLSPNNAAFSGFLMMTINRKVTEAV